MVEANFLVSNVTSLFHVKYHVKTEQHTVIPLKRLGRYLFSPEEDT